MNTRDILAEIDRHCQAGDVDHLMRLGQEFIGPTLLWHEACRQATISGRDEWLARYWPRQATDDDPYWVLWVLHRLGQGHLIPRLEVIAGCARIGLRLRGSHLEPATDERWLATSLLTLSADWRRLAGLPVAVEAALLEATTGTLRWTTSPTQVMSDWEQAAARALPADLTNLHDWKEGIASVRRLVEHFATVHPTS